MKRKADNENIIRKMHRWDRKKRKLHLWGQLPFRLGVWVKGRDAKVENKTLGKRIRAGKLTREDVALRLAELAFGRANDCVKLVLEPGTEVEGLDLSLLTELKRNEKGTLEIRLVDRLRALEQLALLAQNNGTDLESFLKALQESGEGG